MSSLQIQTLAIGGVIALLFFVLFIYRARYKKQSTEAPGKSGDTTTPDDAKMYPPQRAYLYNIKLGKCYRADLDTPTVKYIVENIGYLGVKRFYEAFNEYMYSYKYDPELTQGALKYSIVPVPFEMEFTPSKLYRAKHHPHLPVLWSLSKPGGFLIKYGWFIFLAAIAIFFVYTIVAKGD